MIIERNYLPKPMFHMTCYLKQRDPKNGAFLSQTVPGFLKRRRNVLISSCDCPTCFMLSQLFYVFPGQNSRFVGLKIVSNFSLILKWLYLLFLVLNWLCTLRRKLNKPSGPHYPDNPDYLLCLFNNINLSLI